MYDVIFFLLPTDNDLGKKSLEIATIPLYTLGIFAIYHPSLEINENNNREVYVPIGA